MKPAPPVTRIFIVLCMVNQTFEDMSFLQMAVQWHGIYGFKSRPLKFVFLNRRA